MTIAKHLFSKTLLYYLAQEFWLHYTFKFVLPRVNEITLDGLRLDVSSLSPKIRNRLRNGLYEIHEKEMCRQYLSSKDAVLEIGGAIGYIGLYCQKHLGITEYACFEANPRTTEILKRNYTLNNLRPNVWNMALAQSDGEVELEVGSDFWENSIVYKKNPERGCKTVKVSAGSLETLMRVAGIKPNVLIVDIEGAEQFIDFKAIPEEINKIIIELHPAVIGQEATYNIVSDLIQKGFKVAREDSDTFIFIRK
ncbi:MAG: FkbM family methyltransferase [Verrucomicrobiota bacterium]|nr:FkbM family methyltransferase [Verrucomicrobiota bacterium]